MGIAFFVCWIPRQMIILINVVNPSLHKNHTQFMNLATKLTVLCAFSNVAMVPLVYCLSHKEKKKPKKSFSISSAFRQSSTNLLQYRTKAETNQTINTTDTESIPDLPFAGGKI